MLCLQNCLCHTYVGVIMFPNHIQEKLNAELFSEELSVIFDDRGQVLDVPDLHMKLCLGPDAEVEEQVQIYFEE